MTPVAMAGDCQSIRRFTFVDSLTQSTVLVNQRIQSAKGVEESVPLAILSRYHSN